MMEYRHQDYKNGKQHRIFPQMNAPTAVIELVDRDIEAKGKDSGPVIEKKSNEEEEQN